MPIRCRVISDPVAKVGGKMTGTFPLALFKAQIGIRTEIEGCELDVVFKIISYRVTVFKNSKAVYTQNVFGNRFSNDVSTVFGQLKSGDIVRFDNVKATGGDTAIRILNELVFTMQ